MPVIKLFNIYIQTTTQLVSTEWIYAKDLIRIVHSVTKKHLSLHIIPCTFHTHRKYTFRIGTAQSVVCSTERFIFMLNVRRKQFCSGKNII